MEEKIIILLYIQTVLAKEPREGGWGAYIIENSYTHKEIFGYESNTTNNRMELTARIEALKYFKNNQELEIFYRQ